MIGCRSGAISDGVDGSSSSVDDYDSIIIQLQNKINELESEQSAADSENAKKLEELKSRLESLKADSESTEASSSEQSSSAPSGAYFTYTTSGSKATITGYTGDDEELIIPSYIDGYKVESIADSAFSSEVLKRVTVPNGVKSIGWFAFYACPAMTSITLPESIESIGHSAFSPTGKLTIYCYASSFAHEYARSYALDYALI